MIWARIDRGIINVHYSTAIFGNDLEAAQPDEDDIGDSFAQLQSGCSEESCPRPRRASTPSSVYALRPRSRLNAPRKEGPSRPGSSASESRQGFDRWSSSAELTWELRAQPRPHTSMGFTQGARRRPEVLSSLRVATPTPHMPLSARVPTPTPTPQMLVERRAPEGQALSGSESPDGTIGREVIASESSPQTAPRPVKQKEVNLSKLVKHRSRILERVVKEKAARKLESANAKAKAAGRSRASDERRLRSEAEPHFAAYAEQSKAIKRIILDSALVLADDLTQAPERQPTYLSDELFMNARELGPHERDRIGVVFSELGPKMGYAQLNSLLRRLNLRLTAEHAQRVVSYFMFPVRFRYGGYTERVSLMHTCVPEKRARICFGLLDADGDGCIGARDVFEVLQSANKALAEVRAPSRCERIDVTFIMRLPLGLEVTGSPETKIVVQYVQPGGLADQRGLQKGDKILEINGFEMESLSYNEIVTLLREPLRPLQVVCLRGNIDTPIYTPSDFKRLQRCLKERGTTRLRATIISARASRTRLAQHQHDMQDAFCTCEVAGKPSSKVQTRTSPDGLEPVWNEDRMVSSFVFGDSLRFVVRYKASFARPDEILGKALVTSEHFSDSGAFEGELELREGGRDGHPGAITGLLRIRLQLAGDGGIGIEELQELIQSQGDFEFYDNFALALTGSHAAAHPGTNLAERRLQGFRPPAA